MFLNKFNTTILLLSLLIFSSCTEKKKPCKLGNPVSLFSAETAGIKDHSFTVEEFNSIEKIKIDSIFPSAIEKDGNTLFIPIELTILQSGCEEITQEIRIEFFDKIDPMPKTYPAPDCADLVAEIFRKLSVSSPNAIALGELGKAIFNKIYEFEYGNAIKLQKGFSLQIDKIHSSESTLVTVIFKQA